MTDTNGATAQPTAPPQPIYQFPIIDNGGIDMGIASMLANAGVEPRTAQIVEYQCRQVVAGAVTQVLSHVLSAVQRAQAAKYAHISRLIASMPHMGAIGWMPEGVREAMMQLAIFEQGPPIVSPTDGAMIFPQRPAPAPAGAPQA